MSVTTRAMQEAADFIYRNDLPHGYITISTFENRVTVEVQVKTEMDVHVYAGAFGMLVPDDLDDDTYTSDIFKGQEPTTQRLVMAKGLIGDERSGFKLHAYASLPADAPVLEGAPF